MKKLFIPILAILMPLLFVSCDKEGATADFSYTVDGMKVTFKNESENADSYSWSFGDGASSTDENPTHTYAKAGSFTVSLTASHENGDDTRTETITIEAANGGATFPTFAGAEGMLIAINNTTYQEQLGFPIEIKAGLGLAFCGDANSYKDMGTVSINSNSLSKQSSGLYMYTDMTAQGITGPVKWEVSGGADCPVINYTTSKGMPSAGDITSGNVSLSADYTVQLQNSVRNADSVIVVVTGGSATAQMTFVSGSAQYTLPENKLAGLGATDNGLVTVVGYNFEAEGFGGKTFVFVNEVVVSKSVKITN